MYESGTILSLKQPREPDPETGEEFAYNEVEVINRSPISHAAKGDWSGSDAEGVIITPRSNFGATLDEPFGKLRTIYSVKEVPVREVSAPTIRVVDSSTSSAGPTPEEVFAEQAPGKAPEPGQTRARTSPLADPGPANARGPLDQ